MEMAMTKMALEEVLKRNSCRIKFTLGMKLILQVKIVRIFKGKGITMKGRRKKGIQRVK